MSALGLKYLVCLALAAAFCLPSQAAWALGHKLEPSPTEREILAGLKGKAPGEIVFASRRDGYFSLYRMDADGTGLLRLSSGRFDEMRPHFVRNGQKLIFESNRERIKQVWMSDPDLGNARRLSPQGQREHFHGASEDGTMVLVRAGDQPTDYILRFPENGEELRVDFSGIKANKGWLDAMLAPDGKRLGFLFRPQGGGQLEDGVYFGDLGEKGRVSNPRKVSDGCMVGWRPDSGAFLTCRTTHGGSDMWLVTPDGKRERITTKANWDYWPAFSPDAQWVVWGASPMDQHDHVTGNYEIYIMPLKGGKPARLTFHTASDRDPVWRLGKTATVGHARRRRYEGEYFSHEPAQVLEDDSASQGRAALTRRQGQGGLVLWGQYDRLPAGEYEAGFVIKLDKVSGDGPVARLDVAHRQGSRVLASREIRADDLPPGLYHRVELPFTLERAAEDLECRVNFFPGGADLYVDYVEITPAEAGLAAYFGDLLRKAFLD